MRGVLNERGTRVRYFETRESKLAFYQIKKIIM